MPPERGEPVSAMIRSVLVPVDFGEASAHAVTLAGRLASATGAALQLLHAEPPDAPPYFTQEQMDALERERQTTRAQAARYLAQFGREHARHPFSAAVDDRSPVDAILKAASTADLVVMGTHGRQGPSRWWLGSVAERVVRESLVPVLVVKAQAMEPAAPLSRLLVETDPSVPTTAVRDYASALASSLGARIDETAGRPLTEVVATVNPDLVIVPRTSGTLPWSHTHESLVRTCRVPVLFVPNP